jgi:RimJ/RimL family protein N-acetyltransferase
VTLRDGSVVTLVPMAPADAERLVRFHAGLSPQSVYRRFFSFHPELSPDELYRFTHVDHRDREAIVASDGTEIVAVARFDRTPDPAVAEVAFVVADSWQGRGLGSLLFQRLADRARALGLRRFVADTLPENARMLAVFHHAGVPLTSTHSEGVLHLTLELDAGG